MAPVPIALCGKSSGMASSFAQSMLPEYEGIFDHIFERRRRVQRGLSAYTLPVVHHFQSTAAAHKELPPLLRGEAFTPQSDVGTDATSDKPRIPRAVMVGAGFSRSELAEMQEIEGAQNVPWLYPDPLKSAASTLSGPFLMTVIAKRVKSCLKSNGVVEGQETDSKGTLSF
ncbi:hypothetical protein LTR10_009249 [Elasticomyces elasticus]|nr:hypothetical protein LTR10_009249 [Elasticomyces elasticus]KAK4971651.1 hypothetical protein LTR42_007379 [Elasticomyces elasticus]KAK5713529.1 hypothetical protein LTR15_011229 [Elasticomyces elasticus]